MQVETIASVLLAPSPKQRLQLDQLFSGPLLVSKILRDEGKPIRWAEEASFFLLRNINLLEPFLFTQDRDHAIDLLKSLILCWSNKPPSKIGIAFKSNCSISSANQVFFPVAHLGTLGVDAPADFLESRRGATYRDRFSLVCDGASFYAEIPFLCRPERIEKQGDGVGRKPNITKSQTAIKKGRLDKASQNFEYDSFMRMFVQRVNEKIMQELKISKSLKTVQFSELSGRAVQGGLPSLGKRR